MSAPTSDRNELILKHTNLSKYRVPRGKQSNIASMQCIICLQPINPRQSIRTLKCFHVFHDLCILQWLTNNDTCPHCRFKFDTVQHIPAEPNQVLIIDSLPSDVYFTPNQRVEEFCLYRPPIQEYPELKPVAEKLFLVFPLNYQVTTVPDYIYANKYLHEPLPNTPSSLYRQLIQGEITYEVNCYRKPFPTFRLLSRRINGEVDLFVRKTLLDELR